MRQGTTSRLGKKPSDVRGLSFVTSVDGALSREQAEGELPTLRTLQSLEGLLEVP